MRTTTTGTGPHPTGGPWAWTETLATARVGERYRVRGTLYSTVRERCEGLGIGEGDVLTPTARPPGRVTFVREDGQAGALDQGYAWFVQVEPV